MNTTEQLLEKALECLQQDQLTQAVEYLWELIDKNPDCPKAKHHLGLVFLKQKKFEAALSLLLEAEILDPHNPSLENHLATIYKHLNNDEKALQHYQKAILLQPDYAEAYNNLAALYAQQGQLQESLHYYREAVHLAPDLLVAHFNLGLLLLKMNNPIAAKVQFANVLTLFPQHPGATFYWGVLLLEEEKLDEADTAFAHLLQLNPEHVEALVNRGVIALKKNESQLAVDFFTKALALDNDNSDARNNLAATFIHHDRFENALTHYDILLKKEPDNPEYHYNAGVAQMALGHLDSAIFHFEKVIEINPQHHAALSNLASIYLKKNDKTIAKQYLLKALEAKPDDASSQHMLNALEGNLVKAPASPVYATNLFNNYAIYYDNHMRDMLRYALPDHIKNVLKQQAIPPVHRILDAGCGTGLTGIVLREYGACLVGIDIAAKMLSEARKKNVYDALHEAELLTWLQQENERYDLIVIADVLPYFGDLQPLFTAIESRLNPQGYCIFSIEISELEPWKLQTSARFSHHPAYIDNLCQTTALTMLHQEKIIARLQDNESLCELLYLVQKQERT